jgi:hypothetical protein
MGRPIRWPRGLRSFLVLIVALAWVATITVLIARGQ